MTFGAELAVDHEEVPQCLVSVQQEEKARKAISATEERGGAASQTRARLLARLPRDLLVSVQLLK